MGVFFFIFRVQLIYTFSIVPDQKSLEEKNVIKTEEKKYQLRNNRAAREIKQLVARTFLSGISR